MAARKLLVRPGLFTGWLRRMGYNDTEAARRLGCNRNSIAEWREHGAPYYVGIAAAALEAGKGKALNIALPTDVHRLKNLPTLHQAFANAE